mmetsp:Transcript_9529/g.13505  ORF Transcript_9529/g.13505 Transcript_9529/m.13505 type:complete len:147 (-) Transcript_9529:3249-3689(-)
MFITFSQRKFTVIFLYFRNYIIHYLLTFVINLDGIYIPCYGALMTINDLVLHTPVVWIQNKTHVLDLVAEHIIISSVASWPTSSIISTNSPLNLITSNLSSGIYALRYAPGMSHTTTLLLLYASITKVVSSASNNTVGDDASLGEM